MKKALVVLILICSLCVGFVFFSRADYKAIQEERDFLLTRMKTPAKIDQAYQENLAQWVFSRSNKISMSMSRQIVAEAMKCDYPLLILSLIRAESEFTTTAISSAQAWGLTQVRYSIHGKALVKAGICTNARDLFDVDKSIRAGNLILMDLLNQYGGDPVRALEGYVGGKQKGYVDQITRNHLALALIKK
jgi:soluble lytic murein transglycosylase-like protein